MLNNQNNPAATAKAAASQLIAKNEVLNAAETPYCFSAETAPTTMTARVVDMPAAAMMAVVKKPETMNVQQLPTREQKAKRPTTSSRAARTPAMM